MVINIVIYFGVAMVAVGSFSPEILCSSDDNYQKQSDNKSETISVYQLSQNNTERQPLQDENLVKSNMLIDFDEFSDNRELFLFPNQSSMKTISNWVYPKSSTSIQQPENPASSQYLENQLRKIVRPDSKRPRFVKRDYSIDGTVSGLVMLDNQEYTILDESGSIVSSFVGPNFDSRSVSNGVYTIIESIFLHSRLITAEKMLLIVSN